MVNSSVSSLEITFEPTWTYLRSPVFFQSLLVICTNFIFAINVDSHLYWIGFFSNVFPCKHKTLPIRSPVDGTWAFTAKRDDTRTINWIPKRGHLFFCYHSIRNHVKEHPIRRRKLLSQRYLLDTFYLFDQYQFSTSSWLFSSIVLRCQPANTQA